MKVEGHIWLESDNGLLIGKGRVLLLEKIHQSGTIAQAAKELNISYRKAWAMIREMNKTAPQPLVHKSIGGHCGGGSQLTREGLKLIQQYKDLQNSFEKFKTEYKLRRPQNQQYA